MADDFDVEAMLEAPYRKEDDVVKTDGRADKERRRRKSRSSSRSRSTSPVKHRR
uniref:Uncharacterized protein n=1 Tax=Octopus bimaculoides TaxID=37653 RepID=A0A0L8G0I0_OCTBM